MRKQLRANVAENFAPREKETPMKRYHPLVGLSLAGGLLAVLAVFACDVGTEAAADGESIEQGTMKSKITCAHGTPEYRIEGRSVIVKCPER
jgi:hypothetical protein